MEKTLRKKTVNNHIFEELGERWYQAEDDPIALLRAEARFRNPWIGGVIRERCGAAKVLDVGCGAGFLSNELARYGHQVWGIDLAEEALTVASAYDDTHSVVYQQGNGLKMLFSSNYFDVVCAMDFLEHIEEPKKFLKEVSRVLRPHGLFFFATFNRTLLSHLLVIKAVEWFVSNTPKDLHIIDYFIKPSELRKMCADEGLSVGEVHGVKPQLLSTAALQILTHGTVNNRFQFTFSRSQQAGYMGFARKDFN